MLMEKEREKDASRRENGNETANAKQLGGKKSNLAKALRKTLRGVETIGMGITLSATLALGQQLNNLSLKSYTYDNKATISKYSLEHPEMTGIIISSNWAGYVIASDFSKPQPIVSKISASWIIQPVRTSGRDTHSADWIGIGGALDGDKTIIQLGSASDSIRGKEVYYMWFEMGNETHGLKVPVKAGDKIDSSIELTDPAKDIWTLYTDNTTTNTRLAFNIRYKSSMASAEIVQERPFSALTGLTDISNAPSVYFGDYFTKTGAKDMVTIGGKNGTIGEFPHKKIVMLIPGVVPGLVCPTDLLEDRSSFRIDLSFNMDANR